jgi:hypothetical protein
VHHVLPWQGSGFANLAVEATVREVCAEVGISWEHPRSLLFNRFPAVMKHYLLCPARPAPPPPEFAMSFMPPSEGAPSMQAPPPGAGALPNYDPAPPPSTVRQQFGALVHYAFDGLRGVGV